MSHELMIKMAFDKGFKQNSLFVRTPSFSYKFNEPFCLKSSWINNNFLCAKIVDKKVRFNLPYPPCRKSKRELLLWSDILKRNRFLKTWIGKVNVERYKYQHEVNIP